MTTAMAREAREAGAKINDQLQTNDALTTGIAARIQEANPSFVVLVGRGSSDHAALFAKYLIEVETGLPVVSAAPSVATTFRTSLRLDKAIVIVISQSGRSPDLIEYLKMARNQGALTIALVNDIESPLADVAHCVIPLLVGEETAVAATKSYLGSLSALLQLVSKMVDSSELTTAVTRIPEALASALDVAPQLQHSDLAATNHCVVTGRGFGFAIGNEVALKMKEVCAIQAECFSSAEFLHGPVRIVSDNFQVVDIVIRDETYEMHHRQHEQLANRGAIVTTLACDEWIHPRIQPLAIMQRFYLDLEQVGREMGFNPDEPEGLSKVTETL